MTAGRPRSKSATSTTNRGYGHRHQQARAKIKRIVDSGKASCSRCGQPISPLEKWDLDHLDGVDKRLGIYNGASHRACNRSYAGAAAERRRQQPRPPALSLFD